MMQRFRVTLLIVSRPRPDLPPEGPFKRSALVGFTEATSNRWATTDCPQIAPETHTAKLTTARNIGISLPLDERKRSDVDPTHLGHHLMAPKTASAPG